MSNYEFTYGNNDFASFVHPNPGRGIFENATDNPAIDAAASEFSDKQMRAIAMSCVLDWATGGDFSGDALDLLIQAVSDLDESGDVEPGSPEEDYYNAIYNAAANAMSFLGADPDMILSFLDDGSDDAGRKVGQFLSDKLNTVDLQDDDIIANYSLQEQPVMESLKKAIRGGVLTLVRKRRHFAHKISALMRAGLKKARAKAHSSIAKFNFRRSLRIRKQHGLK